MIHDTYLHSSCPFSESVQTRDAEKEEQHQNSKNFQNATRLKEALCYLDANGVIFNAMLIRIPSVSAAS